LRRKGFILGLARHGISDVPTVTVAAPALLQSGREAVARLLDGVLRPDAIFCSSDLLAQGGMAEAQSRGLTIPGDLGIIGFSDLELAAHTFPALTSVRIDRRGIGRQAAEIMLALMEGGTDVEKIINTGFEIIERAST
jgi:LacI family gluconate utilization system Gnt-I transcriptional repressor